MAAIERISLTYRHLGRYRKIQAVLVRHGFGGILGRLDIFLVLKALATGGL